MGWRYEISVWEQDDDNWGYKCIQHTNWLLMAIYVMYRNRSNGCIKLEWRP